MCGLPELSGFDGVEGCSSILRACCSKPRSSRPLSTLWIPSSVGTLTSSSDPSPSFPCFVLLLPRRLYTRLLFLGVGTSCTFSLCSPYGSERSSVDIRELDACWIEDVDTDRLTEGEGLYLGENCSLSLSPPYWSLCATLEGLRFDRDEDACARPFMGSLRKLKGTRERTRTIRLR